MSIPVYNPSLKTIPAFALVRINGDAIRRGHHIAWPVVQAGDHAADADSSRLAFVGPSPIVAKGYGQVTKNRPARVQTSEVIPVGLQLGPRLDGWDAGPGGEFTSLGRDTITARESGASLHWATPGSLGMPVWCQGWFLNDGPISTGDDKSLLNRDYPLRFRLQQPPQLDANSDPIDHRNVEAAYPFEPIHDDTKFAPVGSPITHTPLDYEKTYPIFRNTGWVKVLHPGRYLIQFHGIIFGGEWSPLTQYVVDNWWHGNTTLGVGLFGRKPRGSDWEEIDQPAVLAARNSKTQIVVTADSLTVSGPEDINIDESHILKESISATAVIELGTGWAFGLLPIRSLCNVYLWNWSFTCAKIGESHNPDKYWKATAEKIDSASGWFVDPALGS